jgi:hypothetical protein
VAGGYYTDSHGHSQAWVAEERKGRWGKAIEVPGTAALNQGGAAGVGKVSCARTSACVAVGTYTDKNGNGQWFTASEHDGRWSTAAEVPYPALASASISTVWCAAGGLCAAGGSYTGPGGSTDAWVRAQVGGRWQPALEVPGLAALNTDGNGAVTGSGVSTVACASAGNCAAGGYYLIGTTNPPTNQPFVVNETKGIWGKAEEVPSIETVSPDSFADANTTLMTCPSAGNCTAAGYYQASNPEFCETVASNSVPWARPGAPGQPPPPEYTCSNSFLVNERNGTWGAVHATEPNYMLQLTCPAAGDCVAVGSYEDADDIPTGELDTETNGSWGPTLVLGNTSSVDSVSCASPGNCAAGGSLTLSEYTNYQVNSAFVISEWDGTWGKVFTPRGIPPEYNPNDPGSATVTAVACPPKITLCTAGGNVTPVDSTNAQAFTVSQSG